MGKFLTKLISGSVVIAALLALGVPVWAQTEATSFCLPDQVCNSPAYNNCISRASRDDKQAFCECFCKFGSIKDMSTKECLTDVCGVSQGGIATKLSVGSVFHGDLFDNMNQAAQSCLDFVSAEGITDNHTCVVKDFYRVTQTADAFLVHVISILGSAPTIDPTNEVVYSASYSKCAAGINADWTPIPGGVCDRGLGCLETPPSTWIQQGCGTGTGTNADGTSQNPLHCCTSASGCYRAPDAGSTGQDAIAGNGQYGTSTPCPAL